jgi:transposase
VIETPATREGELEEATRRVAWLEAALTAAQTTLAQVTAERDKLRRAYAQLKEQLELLRRRIYAAKADRVDIRQLELEFAETKKRLDALAAKLAEDDPSPPPGAPPPADPPAPPPRKTRPSGRRDLGAEDMPEERVEILDPAHEGVAERIGFEVSYRLGFRRASRVRVVVARATYKVEVPSDKPAFELVTVKKPKELVERGILAPTMIAHILIQKYQWGLPFHRQERMLAAQGIRIDNGTMGRYAEHVGASLGCIVLACAKEARETAFCLSTDATGVCIQPDPQVDGRRQACRKGHFFVVLADRDHVFFEFQPKHTSEAVCEMFRGFNGYIQADAHAIYDAVFRGEACDAPGDPPPREVGCWSHYLEQVIISRAYSPARCFPRRRHVRTPGNDHARRVSLGRRACP